MKLKLLSITVLFLGFTFQANSQDCNIGNEVNTNSFQAGSLLGTQGRAFKKNLSQDGVLKSMTFITGNAGDSFRMAIYSDNAGVPGAIVASTNAQTTVLGNNNVVFPSTNIVTGDYWLMIVFESDANLGVASNGANDAYEMQVNNGSAFPITANGNITTNVKEEYLLSLEIECTSTSSISSNPNDFDLNIYPNPTVDLLNIKTELLAYEIELTDLSGKVMFSGSNTKSIDVSALSKGVYMVGVNSENGSITKKIIKK